MPLEYIVNHNKGDTFVYRGVIRKNGQPRALVTNSDVLEFTISVEDDLPGLILKTIGSGIVAADDGSYIVTIPPTEIERDVFPLDSYRYALRLTEGGDPDQRYTILRGDFLFKDTPFSIT